MVDSMHAAALPPPDAVPPSASELAAFARQQWEALLLYLVDGASSPPGPLHMLCVAALDVPSLLAAAGLMLKNEYTQRQSEPAGRRRDLSTNALLLAGLGPAWAGGVGLGCVVEPAKERARCTAPGPSFDWHHPLACPY